MSLSLYFRLNILTKCRFPPDSCDNETFRKVWEISKQYSLIRAVRVKNQFDFLASLTCARAMNRRILQFVNPNHIPSFSSVVQPHVVWARKFVVIELPIEFNIDPASSFPVTISAFEYYGSSPCISIFPSHNP